MLERHDFEVGLVGDRAEVDSVGLGRLYQLRQGQQLGHVVAGFLGQRQVPVIGRQAPLLVALDSPADGTFASVVSRQCQQPVLVEQPVQIGEITQRGGSRCGDVATPVVPAGLLQIEVPTGGGDELPETDGLCRRIGERIVGAFDDRQQRQLERHVALLELLDDVMDVGSAALADHLDGFGAAGEYQSLLLDAWVTAQVFLQLEPVTNPIPDVLVGLLGGFFHQPKSLRRTGKRRAGGCLSRSWRLHGGALAAGKHAEDGQCQDPAGGCQGVRKRAIRRVGRHWLDVSPGAKFGGV